MSDSVWSAEGTNKDYEHYRTSPRRKDLHQWVDDIYSIEGVKVLLDKDFIDRLRNDNFFARLWELELAKWLYRSGVTLVPTNGHGPDFCLQLSRGQKVWIEAVLAGPNDELSREWRANIAKSGEPIVMHDFPKGDNALRYASALYTKAIKIKKYIDKGIVGANDIVMIAISGFAPGALHPEMEHFLRAILPMGDQLVHFSTDGKPLDRTVPRATHTDQLAYVNKNGSDVLKQFLYPGTHFPYIDGAIFSEASGLQLLLGTWSAHFDDFTSVPHVFPNYASNKALPSELTDYFYTHEFVANGHLISVVPHDPKKRLK